MLNQLKTLDAWIIEHSKKLAMPFARFSLFVIYFWFGILKLTGDSPANTMVQELQQKTLPFLTFEQFIVLFSLFEMLIGILFLIPPLTRVVLVLLSIHMVTVFMPLILLPQMAWQAPFVPTLEGQYMVKNLLIIALGLVLAGNLKPLSEKK